MQVEIEDQSSNLEALKNWLQIDPKRTAVVTVDMHRGHLDPAEATMPVPMDESARVLRHAKDILSFARKQGIPVIHVILVWRPVEIDRLNPRITAARMTLSKVAPKTDAQRRGLPHNLEGSVQTQLMPEVGPEKGDYIVNNKKTLSIFMGTDLEHLLKVLDIDTVVLIGEPRFENDRHLRLRCFHVWKGLTCAGPPEHRPLPGVGLDGGRV
jgi:nicotinamidase-related amidase